MSKPWMPLYIADYRNKTAHLTAAEHGAYLLLIMHYWVNAGLPAEEGQLMRIAAMVPGEWKKSRRVLQAFFYDGWKHKRIDDELAKADEISSKRRAAAEQRHSKRDANAHANAEQTTSNRTHTRDVIVSSSVDSFDLQESQVEKAYGLSFGEFWEIYPNKVGKAAAQKAFDKAKNIVDAQTLRLGLFRYVAKTDDRPWCNPATWLNQHRWGDQPAQLQRGNGNGHGRRTIDDVEADLLARAGDHDRESPEGAISAEYSDLGGDQSGEPAGQAVAACKPS